MYDLVITGAGITAATLVSTLKDRFRTCVLDSRPYMAGNCLEENRGEMLIHRHGSHIFHCSNPCIVELSAGRLGSYLSFGMHQAAGRALAERLWKK
jgi:UDP-galactopyranose mutase